MEALNLTGYAVELAARVIDQCQSFFDRPCADEPSRHVRLGRVVVDAEGPDTDSASFRMLG